METISRPPSRPPPLPGKARSTSAAPQSVASESTAQTTMRGVGGSKAPPTALEKEIDDSPSMLDSLDNGPTGTSLLFTALEHAGVEAVAGETPAQWQRRCLHSIRTSGLPARLRPGFWDNDGLCCGTAGVGMAVLPHDRDFARTLADACVDRAVIDGDTAYWRFVEHRNDDPLLPPGVGWMQGAAGIAAFLFRASVQSPLPAR